ncbi:hypothetical protein MSG28_002412 [Choristoneura fumiferana]|uniref:Uncharacterized protein n=1 Tax=Choristoneura fumiferana TaxID=7141 RepID=A0ACC0JVZ4_CHOFU|nr:hypothetical protein MSG28_002412 [Choristoneura fumiferana]
MKKKKDLKKIYVTEDYPKDVLAKRKALQAELVEERKKGKIAFLKYDKLVVKEMNQLTSKEEYWSIIQAYSPTESDKKEDVDKIELFYQNLQRTVDTAHKNVILMGDFNGQIGECRAGEEYAIGRYGHGKRSKNGERLVNFGLENKLSIMNSFYKRKRIRNGLGLPKWIV